MTVRVLDIYCIPETCACLLPADLVLLPLPVFGTRNPRVWTMARQKGRPELGAEANARAGGFLTEHRKGPQKCTRQAAGVKGLRIRYACIWTRR
jgi:hypothetical protein